MKRKPTLPKFIKSTGSVNKNAVKNYLSQKKESMLRTLHRRVFA